MKTKILIFILYILSIQLVLAITKHYYEKPVDWIWVIFGMIIMFFAAITNEIIKHK